MEKVYVHGFLLARGVARVLPELAMSLTQRPVMWQVINTKALAGYLHELQNGQVSEYAKQPKLHTIVSDK